MIYPFPKDTQAILDNVGYKVRKEDISNMGLALDRFLQINDPDAPPDAYKIANEEKRRESLRPSTHQQDMLRIIHQRQESLIGQWKADHAICKKEAKVDYRLTLGIGATHVTETGFCLHRIHGIPFIPGSALKGLARAEAFWKIAEMLQLSDPTALAALEEQLLTGKEPASVRGEGDHLRHLFGTTGRRGAAIFLDAYPTQSVTPVLDILNPHVSEYYKDSHKAPTHDKDPIPSYFLAIDRETAFRVIVSVPQHTNGVYTAEESVKSAFNFLADGMRTMGIGAKTSAGYGVLRA